MLDRAGFVAVEPALAPTQHKFVGALRLPDDETGDCYKFTQRLAAMARTLGVRFRFDTTIERLEVERRPHRRRAHRRRRLLRADRVRAGARQLFAAAAASRSVCAFRSIRSRATRSRVPITDAAHAPESTIMDETHKVAVTRLGDRIRVGGTAELAGYNLALREARRRDAGACGDRPVPGGGDVARAEFWCGLRPMTPDGTPIVGATPYRNLLLATGHGTLGWTMAAGTGRVIADLISGREPEISLEGLGLARYGRAASRRPPPAAACAPPAPEFRATAAGSPASPPRARHDARRGRAARRCARARHLVE